MHYHYITQKLKNQPICVEFKPIWTNNAEKYVLINLPSIYKSNIMKVVIKLKVNGILEKKNNKSNNNASFSKSLILGMLGLILLLIPSTFNKIIGMTVGFVLLFNGIVTIYKYLQNKDNNLNLLSGILFSVLGAIIMLYPHSVINLAAMCLGVYLLILSIIKLQVAINLKSVTNKWVGTFIIAFVILILGLFLIFNPFSGIAITKLAGAFLVAVFVFDTIDVYILQKN